MSTKKMLREYLDSKEVFTDKIHPSVRKAVNCIDGEVSPRLKLSIAVAELITFTSHMRKNIELHDGTLVPCNAIVFALSGSGESKDRSRNSVRKALEGGYSILEEHRKAYAKSKAEKKAILEGKKKEDWLAFYEKPKDLDLSMGTTEGIMSQFANLELGELGAGSLLSSEIGSELQTNGNLIEIIKTISIGYDLGKIGAKTVKSAENQTESIKNLPINALFFGSQEGILFDSAIKNKFRTIFNTQLARRSIFSYSPDKLKPIDFHSIKELSRYRSAERERAVQAQEELWNEVIDICENTTQTPLKLSEDAQTLFDVYKESNALEANDMSAQYGISKLARAHRQWTAMKMSGNYAILDKSNTIEEIHYVQAINTIELFANDLIEFEQELVKENYELLSGYLKYIAEDGKSTINLHELRKLGYITAQGSPKTKMEELCILASSYDPDGIYTACLEGICYEEIIKTDIIGMSYILFEED